MKRKIITSLLVFLMVLALAPLPSKGKSETEQVKDFATSFIEKTFNSYQTFDMEDIEDFLKEGNDLFYEEMEIRSIFSKYLVLATENAGETIHSIDFNPGEMKVTKDGSLYRVDMPEIKRILHKDDLYEKNMTDERVSEATVYILSEDSKLYVVDLYSDDNTSVSLNKYERLEDLGYRPYEDETMYSNNKGYERPVLGLEKPLEVQKNTLMSKENPAMAQLKELKNSTIEELQREVDRSKNPEWKKKLMEEISIDQMWNEKEIKLFGINGMSRYSRDVIFLY